MQRLPKVLEREPLVEALFEVRLAQSPPLGDILPGALFGGLNPKPSIQRLPAADFPHPLRASDPNLQYAPVARLDLGQYLISVSDRSFHISCKMPYPKWPAFKAEIIEIVQKIAAIGIPGKVERFSLKYVNIIQSPSVEDQVRKINYVLKLGSSSDLDNFNIRVERKEHDILHLLSIITGAQAKLENGSEVFGVVIDIDSIKNVDFSDFSSFAQSIETDVEELRRLNKIQFFDCLTSSAIEEMGPIYE